jgi:hypothetical protein
MRNLARNPKYLFNGLRIVASLITVARVIWWAAKWIRDEWFLPPLA